MLSIFFNFYYFDMANKAYYRKLIVEKRALMAKEREAKKSDNERYARLIKSASTPGVKASYKKSKIDHAAAHDRRIESLKIDISRLQLEVARAPK